MVLANKLRTFPHSEVIMASPHFSSGLYNNKGLVEGLEAKYELRLQVRQEAVKVRIRVRVRGRVVRKNGQ